MGSALKDLAAKFNLESNKTQAWGHIDGYWFQIALPSFSSIMTINTAVCMPNEAAGSAISKELAGMMSINSRFFAERKGGTISMVVRPAPGGFRSDELSAILLRVPALLRKVGAEPACFRCNAGQPSGFAMADGSMVKLCDSCGAANASAAKSTPIKSGYLRGCIGALAGALIGAAAWVGVGALGYPPAIGSLAIAFFAIRGYELMRGRLNKLAVLLIGVIGLVCMVLGQFISLDLDVVNGLKATGVQTGFWQVLPNTFSYPFINGQLAALFLKNFLFGLIFLGVGGYFVLKPHFKSIFGSSGRRKKT
jgi:hypothetical protein